MSVTTFLGIVRNGKIEPATAVELPEGSEVYVVGPTRITLQVARRKANSWLVGYVGNMLSADHSTLVQVGNSENPEWVWRFDVFITSLAHEPWGLIGTVEVNATSGAILNDEQTKAMLYERGRTYQRPL